jgi:hypothetical protein
MNPTAGTGALKVDQPLRAMRLAGLAVLKANWDHDRRSYLDNFVPFLAESLRTARVTEVTPAEAQALLMGSFGIDIPQHAVTAILNRADKAGVVRRIRRNSRYRIERDALTTTALAEHREEALRRQEALLGAFQDFARASHGREMSAERAEKALLDYIEGHSLLVAVGRSRPQLSLVGEPGDDFIAASFIDRAVRSDPALFENLLTLVQGCMLSAALYLPEPGNVQGAFRDSTIYLDTPLLLRALGFVDDDVAAPTIELLRLARRHGARVACFHRTVAELEGILHSVHSVLCGGRRQRTAGPTDVVGYAIAQGWSASDVTMKINSLPKSLRNAGIDVLPMPDHVIDLTVDESAFDDLLQQQVRYQNDDARRHDLDAITSVHRLRRGRSVPQLGGCGPVLVTTNRRLVAAARDFFKPGKRTWPPAVIDSDLATLLWLKEPGASPDLPRKQVIADCYAALRPNEVMWSRYLDELERLEDGDDHTDEDLNLLRYSVDAQQELMARTKGRPEEINEGTITDVLEATRRALQAPIQAQVSSLETELRAQRDRLLAVEAEGAATQQELAATQAERDALLEAKEAAESAVEAAADSAARRVLQDQEDKASRAAQRDAERWVGRVFLLVTIVLICVAVGSFIEFEGPGRVFGAGAGGVLAVVTCLSFTHNVNLVRLRKPLIDYRYGRLCAQRDIPARPLE